MKLEDKLLDRVDVLSEKINSIGTHAWESMLRYEVVKGIMNISIGLLLFITVIILTTFVIKKYINIKETGEENILFGFCMYTGDVECSGGLSYVIVSITAILLFLSLFIVPMNIYTGVLRIVTPEIYAIKDIVDSFK